MIKQQRKSIGYYAEFHLECTDKWYEHVPDSVLQNEGCKILWDFPIQTAKVTEHRWSDIVCIDKTAKSCLIIDITIPGDQNIISKNKKKKDKKVPRFPNRIGETMEIKG